MARTSMKERTARRKAEQVELAKRTVGICGALKRNGKICMRDAGWGTDHKDHGRCKFHGGATHQGRVAALNARAKDMATPMGPISPAAAVQALLNLAAGQLAYVTSELADKGEDELFEAVYDEDGLLLRHVPAPWLALQRTVMKDLADFAKKAADMGIAERQAAVAEAQTELMAKWLDQVVSQLDLTPAQRRQLGPAIRKAQPALAAVA